MRGTELSNACPGFGQEHRPYPFSPFSVPVFCRQCHRSSAIIHRFIGAKSDTNVYYDWFLLQMAVVLIEFAGKGAFVLDCEQFLMNEW